jgi:hypothetical protein
MTGTAELLRALLMVQNGVTPDGLTDILRQAIERAKAVLLPADAVRMLALLADAETSIRRSASVRLVVETLLLRWTLMDRVVDLEQLIRAGRLPQGGSGGPVAPSAPRGGGAPVSPPVVAAVQRSAPPSPAAASTTAPVPRGELSFATLVAAWPDIVEAARARSNLLGQALEATPPGSVSNGEIRLVASADHAVLVEGIQRQISLVEELVQVHFGVRARITVAPAGPAGTEPQERPKRMTDQALRSEKLERLRRLDPALDAAANELDLEIVDEG